MYKTIYTPLVLCICTDLDVYLSPTVSWFLYKLRYTFSAAKDKNNNDVKSTSDRRKHALFVTFNAETENKIVHSFFNRVASTLWIETGGSGGSTNRAPELLRGPSVATTKNKSRK